MKDPLESLEQAGEQGLSFSNQTDTIPAEDINMATTPEIREKIEVLQDISANVGHLLQQIQIVAQKAEREINDEGLTQPTCVAMAALLKGFHDETGKLFVGGHLIHQDMSGFVPEGGNEGDKDYPW